MRPRVGGLEAAPGHVGVDLRRAEIAVAEQLLDGAQVGAAVQEMRGEAVAKGVRVCRCAGAEAAEDRLDVPLEWGGRGAAPRGPREQYITGPGRLAARGPETFQRVHGAVADRND